MRHGSWVLPNGFVDKSLLVREAQFYGIFSLDQIKLDDGHADPEWVVKFKKKAKEWKAEAIDASLEPFMEQLDQFEKLILENLFKEQREGPFFAISSNSPFEEYEKALVAKCNAHIPTINSRNLCKLHPMLRDRFSQRYKISFEIFCPTAMAMEREASFVVLGFTLAGAEDGLRKFIQTSTGTTFSSAWKFLAGSNGSATSSNDECCIM